ncbi:MAG: TonB-dependent receptor [Bacteroidales bacterium]|nr:TonB-dependent receptor [Bacteroidales bacterium]MDT8431924.1 TonB-dependent receptor [Bacteroidales bacterium]
MKSKLLFTFLLFSFGLLSAQHSVGGKVTDENGRALPGVNIVEKGTSNGTVTDSEGNYSIEVASSDAVLIFSYIGYLTEEIPVEGRTTINAILQLDIASMEEIVVIGYGTVKKKDLTGAVSVVNTDGFRNVQTTSFGEAIQGLASGVRVRSNGNIGAEPNIKIRGIGNISNTNPLYVVDGLIFTGGMRDLNVNDIESVQILKDASAAAIYGNRAANGVIIITTKKGQAGTPAIDFSAKFGIEKLPSLNLMDTADFFYYNDMAYENARMTPQNHFDNSTDWEEEVFQTGFSSDYNIGVSGGSETSRYLVSANYFKNEGTTKGTSLERYSIRVNTEATKGILTVGENFAITNTLVVPYSGGNPITDVMRMTPDIPVYDSANFGGYGFGDEARARTFGTNPIAIQGLVQQSQENARLRGNVFGELKLFEFLAYRLSAGYETSFDAFKQLRKEGDFTLNLPYEPSHIYENKARYQSFILDNLLTFNKDFGNHAVNIVLGSSYQNENYEQIWGRKQNIFIAGGEYLRVLDAGSDNPTTGGFMNELYRISYFGRLQYDFSGKYLFSATVRRDGSSQFGPGYRIGYFPSVSGAWRITEEDFFEVPWLDNLKIRASYGVLGNSAFGGRYDYIPSLTTFPLAVFGTGSDEVVLNGAIQRELVNEDLTWETKKQTNIGADMGFLGNRLQMSADYYISVTEDVLVAFPILIATGNDGGNPWVNAGSLKNSGVDVDLSWREYRGDLRYTISANFTTIKNEVLDLPYGDSRILSGATISEVGSPMAMFYLVESDGIFQSEEEVLAHVNSEGTVIQPNAQPGDLRYVDYDDNGIISAAGDRQVLGNPWPKLEAGLTMDIAYRNWDFSMHGFGAFGPTVYNGTRSLTERFNDNSNYRYGIDPWTPDNTDTDFPRVLYADERNSVGWIDRWLEDGSFFKIRQITLGYTFNIDPIQDYINDLRLSVNVQNPVTFTRYQGLDPEFNNGSLLQFGVDGNSYPSPRIYMFSISANF